MAAKKPYRVIGIRIDIETRSGQDIKHGVYGYTEHPDFEVLINSYSMIRQYPGGSTLLTPVKRLDLNDQSKCGAFGDLLRNPRFQKHAFNANFERVALSRWLGMPTGQYLDPVNWRCSAVRANVNGVFGTLDEVARAVRSPATKDAQGKALIKMFSVPMSARDQKAAAKTCECVKYHDPAVHPAEFKAFAEYCDQDVVTEAAVAREFPDPPASVQAEYEADQRINDRGVRHFKGLSLAAVEQVEHEKNRLMADLKDLTGLDNPNSIKQMRGWLNDQDYPLMSLNKETREEALADPDIPAHVAEALTLKGAASLSSVAKHKAALDTRSDDGRIRGSLRFYGAHTGREAGRGIQPQNLPRYEAPASDRARMLRGTAGADAPEIAKGSVRASLVPARGCEFAVADYNAIEARVLGWLAGELAVLNEFRHGPGKIYEATAATMFGIDKMALIAALKACGKCGHCDDCGTRGKGKVSNLALGYAGSAGALVTMGAEKEGIDCGNYISLHREWEMDGKPGKFHEWERDRHDYPELIRLRDVYRESFPATSRFWKLCAKAWDVAATTGRGVKFGDNGVLSMIRDGQHNRLIMPSGRSIWYRYAKSHMVTNRFGDTKVDRRTFIGKAGGVGHVRTDTHGGKLTENVTQAVARDVLFDLIMKVEAMTAAGWPGRIVLHVHDEVVVEAPHRQAQQCLDDVLGLMAEPPLWAPGLPVKGAGALMPRYGK